MTDFLDIPGYTDQPGFTDAKPELLYADVYPDRCEVDGNKRIDLYGGDDYHRATITVAKAGNQISIAVDTPYEVTLAIPTLQDAEGHIQGSTAPTAVAVTAVGDVGVEGS